MGKEIHKILENRNHEIAFIIDTDNQSDLQNLKPENTDVAIEFSSPTSALANILQCLDQGIKVISGTTGWLESVNEVEEKTNTSGGAFFYASNYSLGVNVFFHLNKYLASVMNDLSDYDVELEEIHHTQKLDQPSGTAITLAEGVINRRSVATKWINEKSSTSEELGIISKREPDVPGTHLITYESGEDIIEIKHTAKSRKGFALGAVKVAEWIQNKKGVLSMDDFLDIGH